MRKANWLLAAGLGLVASSAIAAGYFTNGVPPAGGTQYPTTLPLTGVETVPADTNLTGGQNPASEAISTAQIASYLGGQPDGVNFLIGGDATTNLWQRGTTGASETTTATYAGPDRWFYWSGASTAMTVSRDSTAADLPSAYEYAFKMARTSAQTGVVQMCMAQEVSTQFSYGLAGQTVELDFHAATGALFSPAAPYNMTAYIITGTGVDEGGVKLAYGLNAGGGGSVGWTGQANATAAVISLGGVSTLGRYVAVANLPAAATEVAVALCYTPVGTAGATDYIAFSGIQLKRSPSLAAYVSATVGYSTANVPASAFQRRPPGLEQVLQEQYYYQITEATGPSPIASCRARSTTVADCFVPFPVVMRAVPSISTATAGFATETTTAGGTLGACTTLAASANVTSTAGSTSGAMIACTATTVPAAGSADFLWNDGGSGTIKANAEL